MDGRGGGARAACQFMGMGRGAGGGRGRWARGGRGRRADGHWLDEGGGCAGRCCPRPVYSYAGCSCLILKLQHSGSEQLGDSDSSSCARGRSDMPLSQASTRALSATVHCARRLRAPSSSSLWFVLRVGRVQTCAYVADCAARGRGEMELAGGCTWTLPAQAQPVLRVRGNGRL